MIAAGTNCIGTNWGFPKVWSRPFDCCAALFGGLRSRHGAGLARGFFYAGARALLVSHWPVDSAATVKLTTGVIRALAADPSIGRAEALRRSILAMIDGASDASDEAHPALWAPFILAGEGGAHH